MAINERLQRLVERSRTSYAVLPVSTAGEVAVSREVRGRQLAKVVVLRDLAGADVMIVLSASQEFDARAVEAVTGRPAVRLEDASELLRLFPDCEPGAMPPFGALYGLPMVVDPCLLAGDDVFFPAGNHRELVVMRRRQYEEIARPFHSTACLHRGTPVVPYGGTMSAPVATRRLP